MKRNYVNTAFFFFDMFKQCNTYQFWLDSTIWIETFNASATAWTISASAHVPWIHILLIQISEPWIFSIALKKSLWVISHILNSSTTDLHMMVVIAI